MKSFKNTFMKLRDQSNALIIVSTVAFFAICAAAIPNFLTAGNISSLLSQLALYAIPCMGLAFVMNMGGNDFAIAAQMTFTGVICAMLMTKSGLEPWLAVIITLLFGIVSGAIFGAIIAFFHAPGFIVTLTSQLLFTGLALVLTGAGTISGLPPAFMKIASNAFGKVSWLVIIMLVLGAIMYLLMHKSAYGRGLTAAGVNRKAAYLAGINVILLEASTYVISGFCSAVSGVLMTARVAAATSSVGAFAIIDIIAACVLGGNSLNGGTGNVLGAFVGMVLVSILNKVLSLIGATFEAQLMIKGFLIVAVVGLDYFKRMAAEKTLLKRQQV